MLDHALHYATEKHWPIFPCKRDKTPLTPNGVLDATTNPNKIKEWWQRWPDANIGLDVGGAGMMVLDLDPGHDLAELERHVGKLPETKLWQKTPRGGKHLFYTLGAHEIVAQSSSKLAKNVDIRSFHSYVLLAPSQTENGVYTIHEGKPAFRSQELFRLANSAKEKHKNRNDWIIEPDLPENISKAAHWLKHEAKPAIEGQGGDHTAYATAAMCKSFGISADKALDLMLEHWNPRCQPPWNEGELDHLQQKVENAYDYNTSPPGNMTDAYRSAKIKEQFKPVERDGMLEVGRFRFYDRSDIKYIAPPKWLVHDFIPERSYCLLFGAPGTFKTFVALDIALSIVTGANWPWQGLWGEVSQGPVLFAVGEGHSAISRRIIAWETKHWHSEEAKGIVLTDPVPLTSQPHELEGFIDGALQKSPDGYKLIVLDTVGRSMQGLNENAQQDASRFTQLVETLQSKTGAAVLALHHAGHESSNRLRGSSVFGADADTIVRIDREDKAYQVALTMLKQKDAPEWEQSKIINLEKVGDSLAATQAQAQIKEAESRKSTKKQFETETEKRKIEINLHIVSEVLEDFLSRNKLKDWSERGLAVALASSSKLDVGEQQIRKTYLPLIRSMTGHPQGRHFNPEIGASGKWRYNSKIWVTGGE